jgi:hypothetical protein
MAAATLAMDLSIPKDASDTSEYVPSEEDSKSFPNQEKGSETTALVTADPLSALKADFESQKADFESQKADFESQLGILEADFKSQLKIQNAEIKSLQKSGLFSPSRRRTTIQLEEEGSKQLPPDTFSLLVCSKILSPPFLLGIVVFLFQITIFSLLAGDLINKDSANPIRIPANVEMIVRVTQFLAIIIAVLTQTDLQTSLEQMNEGYRTDLVGKEFGDASGGKWWFATACRFLQGALGLVGTFILIVRVDNVLDLLFGFTAMEFVSQLDNVAFFMAGMGYFGFQNAEKSEEINETTYPRATDEKKRREILHVLLLGVVFSGMLAGWGVIVYQQESNQFLCKRFFVYSSQPRSVESGYYDLSAPGGRAEERVHYIRQKSLSGFKYCDHETVWTFYRAEDLCKNATAKSAETTTFDIETTLSDPWISNHLVQLQPIRLFCVDDVQVGEFPSLNCR